MDYYIDIDAFCDFVTEKKEEFYEEKMVETTTDKDGKEIVKETVKSTPSMLEINTVKYEITSALLESVMRYAPEDGDNGLGIQKILKDAPLDFVMAFNTLENYNIIKTYE